VNTANSGIFIIIYTTDADAGTVSPLNATSYTDEDILWTGGCDFNGAGAGAVEQTAGYLLDVDVKAMRKINTSRDVRFAVESTGSGGVKMSGILRALTRKGGN